MLKKLMIGGAVGASIFGIVGASASALTDSSPNGTVVQQSDALTATCSATNGTPGSGQFQTYVTPDGNLAAIRMYQQDFNNCSGVQAQAVETLTNGTKVYSDVDTFRGGKLDVYLDFENPVPAADVASTQITLAGDISIAGETGVKYVDQYGGQPNYTAP